MVVSSFAIGALAIPVFALGFVDSLLAILFINCLAITPVAFFSTFGPRFGLRQMVLSRFFFGFHGVKVSKWLHASPTNEAFLLPKSSLFSAGAWGLTPLRSRNLQHTRLCGLVRRERHSWRPIDQRCQL